MNIHTVGRTTRYLASVGLMLLACASFAEPLNDQNIGPIPGVFHFPDSTDGANLAARGRLSWSLFAITASHSTEASAADESLSLDGETDRVEFGLRYGLGERFEVGIEVPYLRHKSGGLDSLIDTWHSTLNLPDGDRENQLDDQLRIAYEDASGLRLDLEQNASGIGDLRLTAGWRLRESPTYKSALRFGVSLPTGDSAQLLGSGGPTLSLGLAGDARALGGSERLNGYYRVQAIYIGKPDLLADRYHDFVGQLSAGLGFAITPAIEIRVQAGARSAVYDSRINALGEPAATLTMGANFGLSDNYLLSLGFIEDIKPESAPDVSFLIALRYRPGH